MALMLLFMPCICSLAEAKHKPTSAKYTHLRRSEAAGNVTADTDPLLTFLAVLTELTLRYKEKSALNIHQSGNCLR